MKTVQLLLFLVLLLAIAMAAFLSFTPQKTGVIPPEVYLVSYSFFFFLAGVVLVMLLKGPYAKHHDPVQGTQLRKYDVTVAYDEAAQKISLTTGKDVFELYLPSRLSYRMFTEAVESFRNKQYIGCVNLCHASVEHSLIAELRGGYKKDAPFSENELPRMYQEKVVQFIKKYPQMSSIKDNAIKLWNMNRLTYVQTLTEGAFDTEADGSAEASRQRRLEYCANEESLITGVESIAYESLVTAAGIHKSIGLLY